MSETGLNRKNLPNGQETLKERWYYVLISKSERVQQGTAEGLLFSSVSPDDNDTVIGWVDYTAVD